MKGTVITQENPCKSIHTPMSEFGHVYFLKKPGVNVGRVLIWPEIDEFQHPLYRNLVIKEVSAFYTAWAAYRNSPPRHPAGPLSALLLHRRALDVSYPSAKFSKKKVPHLCPLRLPITDNATHNHLNPSIRARSLGKEAAKATRLDGPSRRTLTTRL